MQRSGQSIHGGVKPGRGWEAEHGGIWRRCSPRSAGTGWERWLTSGARPSVRGEREGAEDGRHESKRKAYSGEYTKGWASKGRWPTEEVGRRGERGGGREAGGWLGQKGRMAGWADKEKNRKVLIFKFN
jgi:hypothetical protein